MRSKLDEGSDTRGKARGKARGKRKSPKGGKALQRLLIYLSERDPLLVGDVVGPIDVPKAAQPKVGPARQALRQGLPARHAGARESRVQRPRHTRRR